jgi:Lrp/AsnC family leucine-responsive transcriptional regulator
MTGDLTSALDAVDRAIIQTLQADGRASIADISRTVAMSATSTADRVRRLSDLGVLAGYTAVVDPTALGYPLTAFARIRLTPGTGATFHELIEATPQILEAHHLTGEECYLLKVVARSMTHLEELAAKFVMFGHVTTNLVFSSPIPRRPVPTTHDIGADANRLR